MKTFLVELWQRVILSYKSTILGILVLLAGEVFNYLNGLPNPFVHTVVGLSSAMFVLWKDKGVQEGAIKVVPKDGRARYALLPVLFVLTLGACALLHNVGHDAKQCASKATIAIDPATAQAAIGEALHSDWADAKSTLLGMASAWGWDFVTCLVADLESQYAAVLGTTAADAGPVTPPVAHKAMEAGPAGTAQAHENAGRWLSECSTPYGC